MKLLRFGPPDREKPGLLDGGGVIRDLSTVVGDITPEVLGRESLKRLAAVDVAGLPAVSGPVRLGVPVAGIRKFLGVGLNYADHAEEAGLPIPSEPVVFMKAVSCLSGPNDDVMLPPDAQKGDWEVELGLVIGRTARHVSEAEALDYVAGYCLVNDVTERGWQFDHGPTWDKGKGFDTFGPVGPWLVTADEVGDPQSLDLWLEVNGRRMQTGSTARMIFAPARIISYLSRLYTLWPGDLITTGTPPGAGMGRKPPVFLKPGDIMRLGSGKLGEQTQRVVAFKRPSD
jgi:2-keto-4-pentenoate hydratase/2-oxohepta-3-ene-1,7-dioic acid hydratase in catechol pathway